ncbi:MAG: alpha/beta fold hydrolase [Planctomycetaceae bacterium]|nr:alpha/beta fold hydrolase [Planctomycetaceae bacterium]
MRVCTSCFPVLFILAAVSASYADDRFVTEDVAFTAACDGTTQRYVRLLPQGFDAKAKHHLLIALHGHGSDRWQFADGKSPTGATARDVAAERGMILILPDYRAKTSWMGPQAEADVCQIIAEVKKQYVVDKVFLCGGSMGGSSALTFAALHPELIDGVASMNGTANHLEYKNFQDAIIASYGGTKQEIPEEYKKRSAEYWPERLTMPVGITASGQDKSVPPESVLRLADVLEKMSRPVLVIYRQEMGHASKPEDVKAVLDFVVDQALRTPVPGLKNRSAAGTVND